MQLSRNMYSVYVGNTLYVGRIINKIFDFLKQSNLKLSYFECLKMIENFIEFYLQRLIEIRIFPSN